MGARRVAQEVDIGSNGAPKKLEPALQQMKEPLRCGILAVRVKQGL